MQRGTVVAFLALMTGLSGACGDKVEALTDVAACRTWTEKMAACAAAAPPVYKSALQTLAETAAKEARNAVDAAGLREACQAAIDSTAVAAQTMCPTVLWVPLEE